MYTTVQSVVVLLIAGLHVLEIIIISMISLIDSSCLFALHPNFNPFPVAYPCLLKYTLVLNLLLKQKCSEFQKQACTLEVILVPLAFFLSSFPHAYMSKGLEQDVSVILQMMLHLYFLLKRRVWLGSR